MRSNVLWKWCLTVITIGILNIDTNVVKNIDSKAASMTAIDLYIMFHINMEMDIGKNRSMKMNIDINIDSHIDVIMNIGIKIDISY